MRSLKYLIVFIFFVSCGYTPIYKTEQISKFKLETINHSGDKKIGIQLLKNLERFKKKSVIIISIDDFYLSKKNRMQLSKNKHPLFLTRGVPGTHDWEALNQKIKQIFNKEFPVYLPIFDKVSDTRKRTYKKILKADVIIFEGWCAGAQPVDQNYLQKNFK